MQNRSLKGHFLLQPEYTAFCFPGLIRAACDLGWLRQEDHEFKQNMDYIVRPYLKTAAGPFVRQECEP